ncbi:hypothetical protein H9Q72_013841 [Fusarium xylarioides]|uniref:F-box domain-containing protein n=1 Tax=Fusarium xylarioides TaxID=221167 RepID=A0A9P7HKW5_9HYPO|nr:hypothetical protein H9Q72_013841 [Fusarium xylarioides]
MSPQSSTQAQSKLCSLPPKVLINILRHASDYPDQMNLSRACRKLYDMLILHIYADAGKQLEWRHMFEAAEDGNCRTLARCLEAGAPVDYRGQEDCVRPLQMAIAFCRPLTVKWLLAHGANPNFMRDDNEAIYATCPLDAAVYLAIRPKIDWDIPLRWKFKGFKAPSSNRLAQNAREMIKILRQAGADEEPLGDLERDHLDSIEAGVFCCPQHKSC